MQSTFNSRNRLLAGLLLFMLPINPRFLHGQTNAPSATKHIDRRDRW